jgi:hypothetical protein
MVIMLPFSFDEIVAMLQFLLQTKRQGKPLWKTFWQGGAAHGARIDPSPPLEFTPKYWTSLKQQARALPRALLISAVLGIWLMFTRLTLNAEGAIADSDHLTGSLLFTFSIVAFSEVVRPVRAINMLFGVWLALAPWLLGGANWPETIADMLIGGLLILLAIPRGPVLCHYANWDRYLAW